MTENIDNEVDVDDESLALAAGGLTLLNSPIDGTGGTLNYSVNSTINIIGHRQ
ncbi:hypothetical protein [Aurantimicrobium minutum]|uniref:hypothetical protein n=1 Tax=Aurantimicrobium minutum TaxID=708131 RepID=UPI0024745690|nr:hypothetical protein [Aurantimicrobium minutum]MDH6423404.1 hypothetical protein [Aurantimicrobium minutum]